MMRGTAFLRVIGRLKPGLTLEQARAGFPRSSRVITRKSRQNRRRREDENHRATGRRDGDVAPGLWDAFRGGEFRSPHRLQ